MKYNPEMNRCRGVDPRLLGQMLGSDTPIEADYTPSSRRSNGCARTTCGCGNRSGDNCGCGTRSINTNRCGESAGNRRSEGCNACDHNDMGNRDLASSCTGEPSLAMVYSPHQVFDSIFSAEEALERGTLFVELDKPWKAGGCR